LKTGKDFIEVKAQLPLMEDLTSTYIPGKWESIDFSLL
jgi:hypothetical protein